jgi:hypothetical protein
MVKKKKRKTKKKMNLYNIFNKKEKKKKNENRFLSGCWLSIDCIEYCIHSVHSPFPTDLTRQNMFLSKGLTQDLNFCRRLFPNQKQTDNFK